MGFAKEEAFEHQYILSNYVGDSLSDWLPTKLLSAVDLFVTVELSCRVCFQHHGDEHRGTRSSGLHTAGCHSAGTTTR